MTLPEGFTTFEEMERWSARVRDPQLALANSIGTDITRMLMQKPTRGEIRTYVGLVRGAEHDADPVGTDDLLEAHVKSIVSGDAMSAIVVYTEYLGARIVHNKMQPTALPLDSEIPYARLAEENERTEPFYRDVIGRMHVQPSLPMLGTISGGIITPNLELLTDWAKGYDWDAKPDSSAETLKDL